MKQAQQCPECKQWLARNVTVCSCGKRIEDESMPQKADFRCQYVAHGRRCPLPGTVSPSLYGANCPWYCSEHERYLGDPDRCEEILNHNERDFERIMEDRIDWRAKLFEDDYRIAKAKIRQWR